MIWAAPDEYQWGIVYEGRDAGWQSYDSEAEARRELARVEDKYAPAHLARRALGPVEVVTGTENDMAEHLNALDLDAIKSRMSDTTIANDVPRLLKRLTDALTQEREAVWDDGWETGFAVGQGSYHEDGNPYRGTR